MKLIRKPCVVSTFAVFLIGSCVFAIFSLYPFSNLTVAWCDMKQQVLPLLIEFRDILLGQGNMFLNLQNAGGMSFWGIFLFFLSSPFSFLVLIISPSKLYLFINIIILMKMAVCAFCASYFFEKVFKNLTFFQNTALSVMYAFCGYTMLYYQNIVWLDAMYLFPVVLLGLYKIISESKPYLFVISFSALIVVHFYLTYMVLLFIILFAAIYSHLCFRKKRREKVLHLILGGAFTSFMLTTVCWLPMLIQYFSSARKSAVINGLRNSRHLTSYPTTLVTVICTAIILPAVLMLFFIKKQNSRQNTSLFACFVLVSIPLIIEPVNKMWHTGSYQAFPSRYGFITVFVGLLITAKVISSLNLEKSLKKENTPAFYILMFAVFGVALFGIYSVSEDGDKLSTYLRTLWMSYSGLFAYLKFTLIIAAVYFAALIFYKKAMLSKQSFTAILCAVVLIESIFSMSVFFGFSANDISFNQDILKLTDKIPDYDEYRVKTKSKYFDVNLVGSLGYGSLAHYTSFTDEDYHAFIKNSGYSSYWMEVSSVGGTKFTDFILGNRYTIVPFTSDSIDAVAVSDYFAIIQNYGRESLAYVISEKDTEKIAKLSNTERILKQNNWFSAVSGYSGDLITEVKPTNFGNLSLIDDEIESVHGINDKYTGLINYNVEVFGRKTLYFDCFHEISTKLREVINGSCNVFVNGAKLAADYPSQSSNGILNLGTFENEIVNITVEISKDINARSFGVYVFNDDLMQAFVNKVNTAEVISAGNRLEISASAKEKGEVLLISVPYSKGFSANVNGKRAQIKRVFDNLMAIELNSGNNDVVLTYYPAGFIIGALVSSVSLVLLISLYALKKKKGFSLIERSMAFAKYSAILFNILFTAALILVYIFPVVLSFT